MKPNDYLKLEKDNSFKLDYLKKTLWWKNILFIAPSCLLFIGLVGLLFLFKNNSLVSWYVIPYLLLFVIGTIWLKAIKKHVQKSQLNAEGSFFICLAKPIAENGGYVYAAFVNSQKRHDKYYISNLVESVDSESIIGNSLCKKENVLMKNDEGVEFYIRAYQVRDVNKRNASWREDELFAVLFIDNKDTPIVKKKDLIEATAKK
ncbi:MAG: hypothetical protein E6767_03710 [Dysgonomonas sp.]|nr:hypothetical protein [Dysgonomonas sp.]